MTTRDRIHGAIYGHLVGDALGVPYEFTHHIETVEWRGHGTHNQPAGTWSDDGALMLALLDSLLDAGFDTADQARRFLDWRDHKKYTPDRDGRFNIGGATSQALARVAAGTPAEEAGDDPDALGNGSLMRILPIALVDPSVSTAELVDRAHRSSRITHGAPACLVACALYVLIARELLAGEQDRSTALERATELLRGEYQDQSDLTTAPDRLLAWPAREGRGHVSDSFWSAWDAFAASDGYRSAVVRAVQYGDDTDTTAAIAGGLAGITGDSAAFPKRGSAGCAARRRLILFSIVHAAKVIEAIRHQTEARTRTRGSEPEPIQPGDVQRGPRRRRMMSEAGIRRSPNRPNSHEACGGSTEGR